MLPLSVSGTYSAAPSAWLAGITDLHLTEGPGGTARLYSVTRPGGGVLAFDLGASGLEMVRIDLESWAASPALAAPGHLGLLTVSGLPVLVAGGASGDRLQGWRIEGNGTLGPPLSLPSGLSGAISAFQTVEAGGQTYAFSALKGEAAIHVQRLGPDSAMQPVARFDLGDDWQGVEVPDFARAGQTLLALSVAQNSLLAFQVGPEGALTQTGQAGAAEGLGLAVPAAVEAVRLGGQDFAVVAAAGSSSISIVAVGAAGGLTVTDHVIDSRDTRFQGVQDLATVTLGDRVFVVAGGGDDGVTLFQLLPGGQLLLAGQVTQTPGHALDNVTALAVMARAGGIDIFVAGEGSGITRLRVDPGALAPIQVAAEGGTRLGGDARGDLLVGSAGGDILDGGAGADILIDGAGSDVLFGGAGADVFVLSRDGAEDRIGDFEPGVDRLDLSAWGRIYAVEALTILPFARGALLRFGDEDLVINSVGGGPIPLSAFTSAGLFALTHMLTAPLPPAPPPSSAPRQGADDLDRGAPPWSGPTEAADRSGGAVAGGAPTGSRSAETSLADDAAPPVLRTEATAGSDRLVGTVGDDMLSARAGNDQLEGGAGRDRLDGGAGNDTLWGGAAADVFVFDGGRDRLMDFRASEGDRLQIEARLGDPAIGISAAGLTLDFGGGDVLTLAGLGSAAGLEAWLL